MRVEFHDLKIKGHTVMPGDNTKFGVILHVHPGDLGGTNVTILPPDGGPPIKKSLDRYKVYEVKRPIILAD
jgi:hypothetical protein